MNRRFTLAAALLTVLVGGCAMHDRMHGGMHGGMHGHGQADPANPNVLVKNGKLSVNLEPLRFNKADGAVNITWRLPPGNIYAFAKDGIVVEARDGQFQCGPGKLPTEYTCQNNQPVTGSYKYTIKVLEKGLPLEPLDPFIVIDS